MHILDAPRLKLKWAEKQLDALESAVDIFQKSNPASLSIEKNPREGIQILRFEFPAARVPLDIGIIAGHAVLDMRSALNWLVCALWDKRESASLGNAEFPIFKDPPKPDVFQRRIKFLPPETKKLVEKFQPYHAGDKAIFQRLWILHQLANMDRHRGIIVRGPMGIFDIPADPHGRQRTINPLNDNAVEVVMSIQDDDFNPNPTFDVIFRAEDVPINITVNKLWDMHNLIANVIFPALTAHIPE